MVVAGDKLVTIVQPSFRPYHLRISDLHLFLHVVARTRQHGACCHSVDRSPNAPATSNNSSSSSTSEMWLPICLPRFNASGFLYCYTNCLDANTDTVLALVSEIGTTEQFQAFRGAAATIRSELGLKSSPSSSSVLEILDSGTSFVNSRGGGAGPASAENTETEKMATDVEWRRTEESTNNSDEDYVDASGDGDKMIPYVGRVGSDDERRMVLLTDEIRNVVEYETYNEITRDYLDFAGALHFLFRLDVPIRHRSGDSGGRHRHVDRHRDRGYLPQCISSPPEFPFDSPHSRRRLWSIYQRLNLRLRLGSGSVESTMDAFDMISRDLDDRSPPTEGHEYVSPGIGRHCPAMCLVESPPNIQGVTYFVDGEETFLAMNGHEFEL